jgi:hypothetical protein
MRHPIKAHSLERLKTMGMPIGSIIDVGVLSSTPDLIRAFPDKKHLLIEPIVEWNEPIARAYASIDHELVNVAASDADGEVALEIQSVIPAWKSRTPVWRRGRQDPASSRERCPCVRSIP